MSFVRIHNQWDSQSQYQFPNGLDIMLGSDNQFITDFAKKYETKLSIGGLLIHTDGNMGLSDAKFFANNNNGLVGLSIDGDFVSSLPIIQSLGQLVIDGPIGDYATKKLQSKECNIITKKELINLIFRDYEAFWVDVYTKIINQESVDGIEDMMKHGYKSQIGKDVGGLNIEYLKTLIEKGDIATLRSIIK